MAGRKMLQVDVGVNRRREWLDKLKAWRGLDKDSHLLDWLIELGRQEMKREERPMAHRTRRDRQEALFEMFVAHSTTDEEVAGMDLITLTQHIHELRESEPDEIPMSDSMVASAILEFARGMRQEAQKRALEFPPYTDAQGNEHAEY